MGTELTEGAEDMLDRLTGGDGGDIAVPSVYPGLGAFEAHAHAYFDNAQNMCEDVRSHDFAVFGALYSIRHGLELWLKYLLQRSIIDDVVLASRKSQKLEDLFEAAECGNSPNKQKALVEALCVMRNVKAGLKYPATRTVEIGETYAQEFLSRGKLDWRHLSIAWPVPLRGHDLRDLWKKAKLMVDTYSYDARAHSQMSGVGDPLSVADLEGICDLLGAWDEDGDAFRYPCALDGTWHIEIPPLNLRKLGELAGSLTSTVLSYEGVFEAQDAVRR